MRLCGRSLVDIVADTPLRPRKYSHFSSFSAVCSFVRLEMYTHLPNVKTIAYRSERRLILRGLDKLYTFSYENTYTRPIYGQISPYYYYSEHYTLKKYPSILFHFQKICLSVHFCQQVSFRNWYFITFRRFNKCLRLLPRIFLAL